MPGLALVLAIHQRHRNLDAVRRRGVHALAGIEGAVEAAGHLNLLQQRGTAGGQVVLVDRTGRDQRLIGIAISRRVEDAVDVRMGAVGRLGKAISPAVAASGPSPAKRHRRSRGKPSSRSQATKKPANRSTSSSITSVAMRNQFSPVFASRRGHRRRDQAEVASPVIGADEPQAIAVVDRVFVLIFARADERNSPSALRPPAPGTRWWCGWPTPSPETCRRACGRRPG